VYRAIVFIWIVIQAFMTSMGVLSTDIVSGTCVPYGAYGSYTAEKAITSSILFVELLFPLISMVFC